MLVNFSFEWVLGGCVGVSVEGNNGVLISPAGTEK